MKDHDPLGGAGVGAPVYRSPGSANLYVADYGNSTMRKITPAGAVNTLAGSPGTYGTNNGTGISPDS